MKLRLISQNKELLLLCTNGSIIKADSVVLNRLLSSFSHPSSFKGNDGYWNASTIKMENVPGQTIAFVDDNRCLVIMSEGFFGTRNITDYITATEFAQKHGKSRASVKNMCDAGRIPGAYKSKIGWMIPEKAPYPKRKQREAKSSKDKN
ncbi:MAG: helix-turn-helix domain-containing protein [Clostridia bacterium]|nr:helix-turn-helix domain-containing protein [Clostridia bacterium]